MTREYAERGVFGQYEDAAYRMSDTWRNVVAEHGPDAFNKWLAFTLDEGRCNGDLYDTKADAIRLAARGKDEALFAFVCITPPDLSPRAAANYLKLNRQLYASGRRLRDPSKRLGDLEYVPIQRPGALDVWRPQDLLWTPGGAQ